MDSVYVDAGGPPLVVYGLVAAASSLLQLHTYTVPSTPALRFPHNRYSHYAAPDARYLIQAYIPFYYTVHTRVLVSQTPWTAYLDSRCT